MRPRTRRKRELVPELELLERVRLFSSGFYGPMVLKDSPIAKQAWALPGMSFTVMDQLPDGQGYLGLYSAEFIQSTGVSTFSSDTQYTPSVGKALQSSTIDDKYTFTDPNTGQPAIGPMSQSAGFFAPKDPGDSTITVKTQAWISQSGTPVIVNLPDETLTLTVEAPTVTFSVIGHGPFNWGWMDGSGFPIPYIVGGTSGALGWTSKQANPDQVGFEYQASVTNTTHYSIVVGFIQTVNGTADQQYTGNNDFPFNTNGDAWDGDANSPNTNVWYNNVQNAGYWVIPSNQSMNLVDPNNNMLPDSPSWAEPITVVQGAGGPFSLNTIKCDLTFKTSLAIRGDYLPIQDPDPTTGLAKGGIPIGLSTATWRVQGTATTNATGADVNNPANWTTNVPTPVPSKADTYPGNGQRSYLSWTSNGAAALQAYNQNLRKFTGGTTGGGSMWSVGRPTVAHGHGPAKSGGTVIGQTASASEPSMQDRIRPLYALVPSALDLDPSLQDRQDALGRRVWNTVRGHTLDSLALAAIGRRGRSNRLRLI